jgi:N-methylhydantoinase A
LSALGILRADVVKELSRTVLLPADEVHINRGQLRSVMGLLEGKAIGALRAEGFARSKMQFFHSLDMRYVGQAYEINVPAAGNVVEAFHRAHQQRYGYHNKGAKAEIATARCRATGVIDKPRAEKIAKRRGSREIPSETADLIFDGREQRAQIYQRDELRAGDNFAGPGIVLEYSATTLIPPRWRGRVDDYGQLLLSRRSGRKK